MGFFGDIKKKAMEEKEISKARREVRRDQFKREAVEKLGTGIGKAMADPLGTIGKGGVAAGKGFVKTSKFAYKGFRKMQ